MTISEKPTTGAKREPNKIKDEVIKVAPVTQDLPAFPAACCTLDIAGAEQERLVKMFKALGNATRFEVMKYLVTHPGCITGDIVEFLPLAQATVSQHLRVLREAGWITGEVEGPATCYHLNEENITWFREKVGEIV